MAQPRAYEQLPLPMQFGGMNLGGRPGVLGKNESPRMLNVFSEVDGVIRTRLSRSLLFGPLSQLDVHSIGKLVAGGVIAATKSPATTAEVAGSDRGWTNPNNVFSSDDVRAEVPGLGIDVADRVRSNPLDITNFSFSIPGSAIPVGIEVHVEGQGEGVGINDVQVEKVQLLKAGVPVGDIKGQANPPFIEGTDEIIKLGGVVDLWGVSWLATDFNASNFGLRLVVSVLGVGFPADPAHAEDCLIDHVEIVIFHTQSKNFYAGAGTSIFRDTTEVQSGLGGDFIGMVAAKSPKSTKSLIYIAEKNNKFKDDGANFWNWVIVKPTVRPTVVAGTEVTKQIDGFASGWTAVEGSTAVAFPGSTRARVTITAAVIGTIEKVITIDLTKFDGTKSSSEDLFILKMQYDDFTKIKSARILFDLDGGNFDKNYFEVTLTAKSLLDQRARREFPIDLEVDFDARLEQRTGRLRDDFNVEDAFPDFDPADLPPGSLVDHEIRFSFSDFKRVGTDATKTWASVGKVRVEVTLNSSDTTSFEFDDLKIRGGGKLDGEYIYAYTYYNPVTRDDSLPSDFSDPITVHGVPVDVGVTASSDPQVDNIRIWRFNPRIFASFVLVATVANTTATIPDGASDVSVASAETMPLDNGLPPLGDILAGPFRGSLWIADDFGGSVFFTNKGRFGGFGANNEVVITSGEDPIRWMSNVGTQFIIIARRSVHRLLGTEIFSFIPLQIAVDAGAVGKKAATVLGGKAYFVSDDGLHRVDSTGAPKILGRKLDPIFIGTGTAEFDAVNDAKIATITLAAFQGELYMSYPAGAAATPNRRIIINPTTGVVRPDDVAARAQFFDLDTGQLVIGLTDGKVYADQVRSGSTETSPTFEYETSPYRIANEELIGNWGDIAIEIDTQGVVVTVSVIVDDAAPVSLGTANTTARKWVVFSSQQVGRKLSVLFQGTIPIAAGIVSAVQIYNAVAHLVAEPRTLKKYDSLPATLGFDRWKLIRRGWITLLSNDTVMLKLFLDEILRDTRTFTTTTGVKKKVDTSFLPITKGVLVRMELTSPTDFRFYPEDSELEWRPLDESQGLIRTKLGG